MLSFSYRFPGMMKGAEGIGGFGRGVMEILPPPFSRNSNNGLGAAALGDWKARLCPACSRKRDAPFLSPFSLPPRGEEARTCLFVRTFYHLKIIKIYNSKQV